MRVDIERLFEIRAELNDINLEQLEDIDFYKDGVKIEIPRELLEKWRWIGLSNVYFITTEFYNGKEI